MIANSSAKTPESNCWCRCVGAVDDRLHELQTYHKEHVAKLGPEQQRAGEILTLAASPALAWTLAVEAIRPAWREESANGRLASASPQNSRRTPLIRRDLSRAREPMWAIGPERRGDKLRGTKNQAG